MYIAGSNSWYFFIMCVLKVLSVLPPCFKFHTWMVQPCGIALPLTYGCIQILPTNQDSPTLEQTTIGSASCPQPRVYTAAF